MTVGDLIKELMKFGFDAEIAIRDGFNGGGIPRTINFGPVKFDPLDYDQHFTDCPYYKSKGEDFNTCTCCGRNEALDYADLESKATDVTIHMGYGFY